MKIPPTSIQRRHIKQQLAQPQRYLAYELGNTVRNLPPLYTRLLAGSLCALVVAILAWAALSRVDEVASAEGQLVPTVPVQPIRSRATGVLQAINVRDGDRVSAGAVLVQFDPTSTQAEVQRLEKLTQQARQTLARLEAERKGQSHSGSGLQNQLFAARSREFNNRYNAAIADANRQLSSVRSAQVQRSRLQSNLSYTQSKVQALRTLSQQGAIPRFDYLESVNKADTLQKDIEAQDQDIQQAQQSYQAAQQNVDRLKAEHQGEILTQLDQQRQQLVDLEAKLKQAQDQSSINTLRAAVTGTIYNLKVNKAAATVQAGEELLSIVPDDADPVLIAKVKNQDIAFVHPQMPVKVKLETLPYQEFGTIEGTVETVSPNAIDDPNDRSVFPVHIRLKSQSVTMNGQKVQLQPGMTARAEIVTRQKTVLSFLIEPIATNLEHAFSAR